MGVQLGPRFESLGNDLSSRIEKFQQSKDAGADPAELAKQQRGIEAAAKETIKVVSEGIQNFQSIAAILQHPQILSGLSPDRVATMKQFGEDFGRLAAALSDPKGPAQNLVAFAMLAT